MENENLSRLNHCNQRGAIILHIHNMSSFVLAGLRIPSSKLKKQGVF